MSQFECFFSLIKLTSLEFLLVLNIWQNRRQIKEPKKEITATLQNSLSFSSTNFIPSKKELNSQLSRMYLSEINKHVIFCLLSTHQPLVDVPGDVGGGHGGLHGAVQVHLLTATVTRAGSRYCWWLERREFKMFPFFKVYWTSSINNNRKVPILMLFLPWADLQCQIISKFSFGIVVTSVQPVVGQQRQEDRRTWSQWQS